jgi:hypothetical protein
VTDTEIRQVIADHQARKDAAALSADQLVDSLESNADHPWKPPGGGCQGALSHDVIHGLDITVALGIDRHVPAERLRIVLGGLAPKQLRYFGVDLAGIQLRADDLDWTFGSGQPLSGSAQHLLRADLADRTITRRTKRTIQRKPRGERLMSTRPLTICLPIQRREVPAWAPSA